MSSEIQLLDAHADELKWRALIDMLPEHTRDVFLLPGYARTFEKVYQGKAGLFTLSDGDDYAVHIFLRRPMAELVFMRSLPDEGDLFDIISPEYSGPIICCAPERKERFMGLFWDEFNRRCLTERIVSEFCRLNPFYNNDPVLLGFTSAHLNRQIVCLDLTKTEKELRKDFSKGNKSSIKKAQKNGIRVARSLTGQGLEEFYRLYVQTMRRNQAKEFYYFSWEYFQNLFGFLKDDISLFTAAIEDKIIAASIFLHHTRYIHYYFSGSDEAYLNYCPNNLLLYEVIRWAQERGFNTFNLGGGYHRQGNDSLYSFKSSFSQERRDFYTYSRVHDTHRYEKLCAAYTGYHKSQESIRQQDNTFFPLYRQ